MDEQLNPLELQEVLREKAAHTSAVLLETVCYASSIILLSTVTYLQMLAGPFCVTHRLLYVIDRGHSSS